jgi:hypothetical protein
VTHGTFVYCICGERHARAVETSLRFLKRVSRADIVVVTARAGQIAHDQAFSVDVPAGLTDHQASILLKTSLPGLVAPSTVACYLDSDQIAVSSDVDRVFSLYRPPVTFAADLHTVDRFSRCAVRCGCLAPPCDHLRRAILEKFAVMVPDAKWNHWNGGLFLFTGESAELARLWHDYTLLALEDPYWEVRDQGTLVAAAWRLGLASHATLPVRFNRIVDRFHGHHEAHRAGLSVADYRVDTGYSLDDEPPPAFLHFINGGVGVRGWKSWDDVEALLSRRALAQEPAAC